jgi:hypothetical protein
MSVILNASVTGSNQFTGSVDVLGYLSINGVQLPTTGSVGAQGATGAQGVQGVIGPAGSGSVPYYGNFYDTTTQSGSADTAYAVKLNSTAGATGIQIDSGSQIKVLVDGIWNLQFSIQFQQGTGNADINVWLRKNGTDVNNSDTTITIGSNNALVAAWNFVDEGNPNDYYQIMWSSNSANTTLLQRAATTSPTRPEIPSAIVTITPVINTFAQGAQGVQGSQGTQGITSQGATGTQGATGAQGPTSQGVQGATGGVGSQGADGSQGATGQSITGPQGIQGIQGASGVGGQQGSQGAQGTTGTGTQGATGTQGVQGFEGPAGQGATGPQGVQGIQGANGVGGQQGTQGATGAQGATGTQGAIGAGTQGSTGASIQGATGAQGATGTPGGVGQQGTQGATGTQGSTGPQGSTGGPGSQGSTGAQGSTGSGTQGATGTQGSAGQGGTQGATGAQGTAGSSSQLVINNNTDNNVLTATGGTSLNGEPNMTFNGSTLAVAGAITATGNITAYYTSDKRQKENIHLILNALEKVKSLNGVKWDWNEENTDEVTQSLPKTGLIAQEVKEVLPEVVIEREDGFLALDYSKMLGLIVEAIKELDAKIK